MVAMELFQTMNDGTITPAANLAKSVMDLAREKSLILLTCGTYGNVIRILVPLTVPDAQLEQGLDILEECLAELVGSSS